MAVDPRYSIEPSLQQLFRDDRDGLPLSNGYVLFFRDDARTVGKQVFRLSGATPNYTMVPYGFLDINGAWRVDLTTYGAFQFPLYYYPYDANGDSQLYFIEIYASDGHQVGSAIEAWPAFTETTPAVTPVEINYAPNGQFLLHTDIVDTSVIPFVPGRITSPITNIAYGGWTYERPSASSSVDIVTFERFGSPTPGISQNPRYALRVQVQSPDSGDTYKDICLKYLDVNKFSSDTQQYTYAFTAVSNTGSSLTAEVILKKNYGTGGSTQTETSLGTFTVTTAETIVYLSFLFGNNNSQTIGLLNDDYLQLCVRLPLDTVSDSSWTDAIVTPGQVTSPIFPVTPDNQMVYESLAGFIDIPAYDSSNVYLPLILTPSGITFDDRSIGQVVWDFSTITPIGYLAADGSGYQVNLISSDNIPYSRLANKWYDTVNNIYKFGTGTNFVTADISIIATPNQIRLSTNKEGSVTPTADGGTPTGFTFSTIFTGINTYNFKSYFGFLTNSDTEVNAMITANYIGDASGLMGNPSTDIPSWTITFGRNPGSAGATGGVKQSYLLKMNTLPTASKYIYFEVVTSSNARQRILAWYKVDGVGTQPVSPVADIYIEIDILSTYNIVEVGKLTNEVLNGRQVSSIITVAATPALAGAYFTFNTLNNDYYVYYKVGGTGTDPLISNKIGILVEVNNGDDDKTVCENTVEAINKFSVGVPDLQGLFPRVYDKNGAFDYVSERKSTYSNIPYDLIGNLEFDSVISHAHVPESGLGQSFMVWPGGSSFDPGGSNGGTDPETAFSGDLETRGVNFSINAYIIY